MNARVLPLIFCLIFFEVILNVSAQLSLKEGLTQIGGFAFVWQSIVPIFLKIIASIWVWIGLGVYIVSVIIWLMILSRVEVSIAYPLVSLGCVINAIAAYYIFGEHVTALRMTGIMVILFGVFLVSRS